MKITGEWIGDPGTQSLCAFLETAGHKALFVGGCVRNSIMDEPVSDIDIATDAVPDVVVSLAQSAGYRVVPTGIEHGTVTVIAGGKPHEVTTFRRDIETNGRHATVSFSRSIDDDASRRDFTMNALYADRFGNVIDPIGGLPDLIARRVRFVGDPAQRIREDFLRILRFFRFHAWYGDPVAGVDGAGFLSCVALARGLDTLSRERVGAEIKKLLGARDPAPAVTAMSEGGILNRVLQDADPSALRRLVRIDCLETPQWMRRLACLADPAGLDLRLSRAEVRRVTEIRRAADTNLSAAAIAWMYGANAARNATMVRCALRDSGLPDRWSEEIVRGAEARFPLVSQDFAPLTGADLGQRLRAAQVRWLESDLRLTREELLR